MRNSKSYNRNQIFKLLEGEYHDSRSKLSLSILEVDTDTWSIVALNHTEILDVYPIDSLEDLYWANNLLMENHNTTDLIMGGCRFKGVSYEDYEKVRQTIIRSFI